MRVQKKGVQLKWPSDQNHPPIRVVESAGIESIFASSDPRHALVAAIVYPVSSGMKTRVMHVLRNGSKKHKRTVRQTVEELTPTVYTPYSPDLQNAETVTYGQQVLNDALAQVQNRLRQQHVISRAYPAQLLADTMDAGVTKSLLVIEHLGWPSPIQETRQMLNRFFILLAANQGRAFAFDHGSSAGAQGLAQFIPSTYALLTRRDTTLIQNFQQGMRDLPNTIRAQTLYLDGVGAELPSQIVSASSTRLREALVAAYNTGSIRVKRALNSFGDSWDVGRGTEKNRLATLTQQLSYEIKSLQRKIKRTSVKKTKRSLRAQLAVLQQKKIDASAQGNLLAKAALGKETVQYLDKYRVVYPLVCAAPTSTATGTVLATTGNPLVAIGSVSSVGSIIPSVTSTQSGGHSL